MRLTINEESTIINTRVLGVQTPVIRLEHAPDLYYHLVFRSNEDFNSIAESERRKFYGFVFGCAESLQAAVESVGGRGSSIHLLIALERTQNPADFVRKIKLFTSAFAKRKLNLPEFAWLDENVSTVSQSECCRVTSYIQSQSFLF